MKLETVYIRFFRSFNFDYLRQDKDGVDKFPWDVWGPDDAYYPFVKVDLQNDVTTVVGANESGKSQLLAAIRCLLSDKTIEFKDFCRYSSFFGVRGGMKLPEFGGLFVDLSQEDLEAIRTIIADPALEVTSFWLFRLNRARTLYLQDADGKHIGYDLSKEQFAELPLPVARVIDADVALPANISLHALERGSLVEVERDRKSWYRIYSSLHENESTLDKIGTADAAVLDGLFPAFNPGRTADESARLQRSFLLAKDLFDTIADVDAGVFTELIRTSGEDDGYGDALVAKLTDALAVSLNFPQWWSQDKDFALEVKKDGYFLALTMRDKTGQTYTFDERSGGMKYFLSYFVQYKSYAPADSARTEILLMDEPDAFLSTQGQQDLLRIFEAYAHPEDESYDAQVVYVTHSPFLIDKNRPARIRVLQKGFGDEGTRVVKKASVDKYEPLRSAFGSFHADTAFIGNCNLLVEGPADQVLFAGISTVMRSVKFKGASLDLNELTMVPVNGASQYRYTLHLTRGRDVDRPAVIVLLDSDDAGREARPDLEIGYKGIQVINPELIFAIGDLDQGAVTIDTSDIHEPEDLVSAVVARQAILHFANEVFTKDDSTTVKELLPATLAIPSGQRLFDTAKKAAMAASKGCKRSLDLEKIEFARSVAAALHEVDETARDVVLANFAALFTEINSRQRQALSEHTDTRLYETTKRLVERFKRDHRRRASKETVSAFLSEIEHQLSDASAQSESVRKVIREIREQFKLLEDPLTDVAEFTVLRQRVSDLVYQGTRDSEEPAAGISNSMPL